jgi:hypothetical protein
MNLKLILIALALVLVTQSTPLKANKIIKAINCGLREGSTISEGSNIKYDNVHIP